MTMRPQSAEHPAIRVDSVGFAHCADLGAAAILIALATFAALTFRDYGLGWDDFTHSQYGDLLLSYYGSGLRDRRAFDFVNLYEYGGGFDMTAALAAKLLPFGLFETRRLIGAIVGILGMIATWRIARRAGGPFAGMMALALIATCSLYVGHMFMNPKDGPFAAAMALLLLALVRSLQEYPRPTAATIVLFGLGLGLTIGTRVIGFMAALYVLPALAVVFAAEARPQGWRSALQRLGHYLVMLLPGALLGYLVMGLVWPWAVQEPLNPLRAVIYFSRFFEKPWDELFGGALIPVTKMPIGYLPTLLALKLSEVLLVFGLGGVFGAIVAATRRSVDPRRRALLMMLALAVVVPIAVTLAMHPAMYNGIRQFVFILPPLAVLGGLTIAWLFDWLRRIGTYARGAAATLVLIGLAVPISGMARVHPYEYTAFNWASGGVRAAQHRYMLDYWGLSLRQASLALRAELSRRGEHPPAGKAWTIAVCGPHPPAQVALGPQFEPIWDPKGADFAMMLGVFYCAKLDAPLLVEIKRDGVTYARVYDIRGRSVTSILTQPPP